MLRKKGPALFEQSFEPNRNQEVTDILKFFVWIESGKLRKFRTAICRPVWSLEMIKGIIPCLISFLSHHKAPMGIYEHIALSLQMNAPRYSETVRKFFRAISCFTYLFAWLSWNAIKWGFNGYILAEILLHTPEIFLHTIWIFLRTR